jgi:hypothetical protein
MATQRVAARGRAAASTALAREYSAGQSYRGTHNKVPPAGVDLPHALFVANRLVGPAISPCLTRLVAYKGYV